MDRKEKRIGQDTGQISKSHSKPVHQTTPILSLLKQSERISVRTGLIMFWYAVLRV